MSVGYTVSRLAEQDLLGIWEYIAEDNVTAANDLLDLFEERFKRIALRPGTGVLREEIGTGLRSAPVGNYLIHPGRFSLCLIESSGKEKQKHGGRISTPRSLPEPRSAS
jgi:plasmid stabilization system protein ParE